MTENLHMLHFEIKPLGMLSTELTKYNVFSLPCLCICISIFSDVMLIPLPLVFFRICNYITQLMVNKHYITLR